MLTLRHIPRRLMTIATIVGGLVGIFLSAESSWDFTQTFLFTLALCLALIVVTAIGYTIIANRRSTHK